MRLFLKIEHGHPMREVPALTAVTGRGLEGDVAFGRNSRQVLLVAQPTLEAFDLQPGQIRENITLAAGPIDDVPAGTRIRIGEAILEVTGDCAPCDQIEAIRPGLREAIRGWRGILARVENGGPIRVGDGAEILSPDDV
jgi:MOSC domain-containing protein YiiM